MTGVVQVSEDVGDGEAREGSAVPDGLNPGILPLDLSERGCTGPEAQLLPSHGHRVPPWHLPKGTLVLPQAQDAPPVTSARPSDEGAGGQYLCSVAARRSKAGQTGGTPKIVDISRCVETFQRESLHGIGTKVGPEKTQIAGMSHSGSAEGGQETAGGDGGRRCGENYEWRPHPPPISMEEYERVVQSGGVLRPIARSNHT